MSEKQFQVFVVEDNDWYNQLLVQTLTIRFTVSGTGVIAWITWTGNRM